MIDIDNISIAYHYAEKPIQAISSLSLHINKGENVAVLGPNGSGKSTLLKAICGLVQIDIGHICVLGKKVSFGGFGNDLFGRVRVVFQEPESQFLMRDVKTEIISVLQNLGMPLKNQKVRFDSLVERFNLTGILDQKPENLSGGQMQLVNLACAIAIEPEVILLDEPTSFLDNYFQATLLDHLDRLSQTGLTIVHITQYPDEATRAGRTIILNNGKIARDTATGAIWENSDLLSAYKLRLPYKSQFYNFFGFDITDFQKAKEYCLKYKLRDASTNKKKVNNPKLSKNPILSIENLGFQYPKSGFALTADRLAFSKGEVVGLIGATGSGKSTLAFLLSGLFTPDSGAIEYSGKPLTSYSIRELRSKIGLTWQLPDLVMLGPTVKEDIEFNLRNLEIKNMNISSILGRVGLKGFENRIVDTLSGGEKRKLSLAGVLAANPDFIIFDEPTAFLDPVSNHDFSKIIVGLANEGKGLIIVGHDLEFISDLADRIVGIKAGKIVCDLPAPLFFSDNSNLRALDLKPDTIVGFRQILSEQGCPLPFGSLNLSKIHEYLREIISQSHIKGSDRN
jgi:energy-coupling factor transport system ATP-binding protein